MLQDNSFTGNFILHNGGDIEIAGHVFTAGITDQCKIICLIEHTFDDVTDLAGAVFGGIGLQKSKIHDFGRVAEDIHVFRQKEAGTILLCFPERSEILELVVNEFAGDQTQMFRFETVEGENPVTEFAEPGNKFR